MKSKRRGYDFASRKEVTTRCCSLKQSASTLRITRHEPALPIQETHPIQAWSVLLARGKLEPPDPFFDFIGPQKESPKIVLAHYIT